VGLGDSPLYGAACPVPHARTITWDTEAVLLADGVTIEDEALSDLCQRHGIRQLALFGSALRNELETDSDIDLLVEFEPGQVPGLLGLSAIEMELEELLGRPVDLRTAADLSRYFRDDVRAAARALYDAA